MSKGMSYHYSGTKGHMVDVANNLPSNPNSLLGSGWTESSHPSAASAGTHTYEEDDTGLKITFDEKTPGAKGFKGKNHYHIHNPNATGDHDKYLDKDGNPVPKGSKKSHILPKGEE